VRNDRYESIDRGTQDIETELGRLTPAPVPPGLRRRVIGRAGESRGKPLLSPAMRIAAVACPILIVALLTADPFLNRHEGARLAAAVDGRGQRAPAEEMSSVLAEVVGGTGVTAGAAQFARREIIAEAAARKERERQVTEARKRLKGWLANEALEDLI
jgi:hypothetical protein